MSENHVHVASKHDEAIFDFISKARNLFFPFQQEMN